MRTIRHEVWINADKQKIFDSITSQEGLDSWWGRALNGEPKVGYVVEFDHGLGNPLKMRVTDLTPAESLSWKCVSDFSDPGNPASEWLGHHFHFELSKFGDPINKDSDWLAQHIFSELETRDAITILRFRHTGWSNDARWYGFCNNAWGMALAGLKNYCETAS